MSGNVTKNVSNNTYTTFDVSNNTVKLKGTEGKGEYTIGEKQFNYSAIRYAHNFELKKKVINHFY